MEENQQEMIFKFSMLEQQIRQLSEQLQSVEEGMIELSSLNLELDELKNSEGREIMASVSKGIFLKAKIVSDELFVDVGGKNFVKKKINETQNMIKEQVKKLEEIKKELEGNMEDTGREAEKLINSNKEK